MKRLLIVLLALVAIFVLVLPASAADLKFGGYFKQAVYFTENIKDGDSDVNDSLGGFWYTRMRLYFTAIASENLRAVSMVEVDANWGDGRIGKVSIDGGSDGRGDAGNTDGSANSGFEIKRAALEFTVPDTALSFKVGLIGAKLGKSGIAFNDDTPALMATYMYSPIKVDAFYSRTNDNADAQGGGATPMTGISSSDDWNTLGLNVRYLQEAFSANLSFAYTKTSAQRNATLEANNDFDLLVVGIDADYKADVWSAYLTAAFNGGENEDLGTSGGDFKGFLFTLGGTYNFSDQISAGLDFYYSSGDDDTADADDENFTTMGVIGRPSYNMDDIVFPGWFDDESSTVNTADGNVASTTNNVRATGITASNAGYTLQNVMAIGAHADWKPLEHTLVQPGIAWMMFAEDVISDAATGAKDDDLGFSAYVRLNQGITDGLALKATFGFLSAGDAYTDNNKDDTAYKFAAGLYWSW